MKKIIECLFSKKSKWIDIEMFDKSGHYKLIQMRYVLSNNKKEFRVVSIGFVSDIMQRDKIYKKVLNTNE
jgi:hypothetical protein